MNRRTIYAVALCSSLFAAASIAPSANAGNVAWGVAVGGPGFSVAAGQPGFYGRPFYRPGFGTVVVAPPVAFPFVAPAPVLLAPRPVVFVRRPAAVRFWRY